MFKVHFWAFIQLSPAQGNKSVKQSIQTSVSWTLSQDCFSKLLQTISHPGPRWEVRHRGPAMWSSEVLCPEDSGRCCGRANVLLRQPPVTKHRPPGDLGQAEGYWWQMTQRSEPGRLLTSSGMMHHCLHLPSYQRQAASKCLSPLNTFQASPELERAGLELETLPLSKTIAQSAAWKLTAPVPRLRPKHLMKADLIPLPQGTPCWTD